jgi:bloom syndrome protein
MCLQDERFRQWLKTEVATEGILGLIIDEVHCISQWGGDFRKLYGLLDQLRGLLPLGTPVHGATATLTPDAVAEVAASLSINLGEAFFLNLGNDRPNITPSVIEMNGSSDFKALNTVLQDPTTIDSPEQLNKAIIFTNSVKKTHKLCQHVRQVYGNKFDDSIAFLHAHRTRRAKRTVMRKFRQGKIRILVATEAAGMVSLFLFLFRVYAVILTEYPGCRHPRHRAHYPIRTPEVTHGLDPACRSCRPLS